MHPKMQCVNWKVGDFGQQFTHDSHCLFPSYVLERKNTFFIKWVRWKKHHNSSEWKEYLVSCRVLHNSDSHEDAAMMCYCGKENFWPLKGKRLFLLSRHFMTDNIKAWKDLSWMWEVVMVNLSFCTLGSSCWRCSLHDLCYCSGASHSWQTFQ